MKDAFIVMCILGVVDWGGAIATQQYIEQLLGTLYRRFLLIEAFLAKSTSCIGHKSLPEITKKST